MTSLFFYSITQIIFGLSDDVNILILARLVAGILAGGFIIAYTSYVTIVAPDGQKVRYLGYLGIATSIGAAFGLLIGGYIGTFGYMYDIYLQISVALFCIFYIYFFLPEKKTKVHQENDQQSILSSFKYLNKIGIIILIEFLVTVGIFIVITTIPLYTTEVLNLSSLAVGSYSAMYPLGSIFSGFLVG